MFDAAITADASLSPAQEAFLDELYAAFATAGPVDRIQAVLEETVSGLLRRDCDAAYRQRTRDCVANYFAESDGNSSRMVQFAVEVVRSILTHRPSIVEPAKESGPVLRRRTDIPWYRRPLVPTSIIAPPPPTGEKRGDFPSLLTAALMWRIGQVTSFFHRRNPEIEHDLPVPFLLAPGFAAQLETAIRTQIVPAMYESRTVRLLAAKFPCSEIDSAEFWAVVERERHRPALLAAWQAAWDACRPKRVQKHRDGQAKTVKTVGPALRALRVALDSDDYTIPKIGNLEIDLLSGLIEPEYDRKALELAWTKLRQIYEQEMDRRIYQDQARHGALRDTLIGCFETFPDRTGEFLVMLCYYNFPRMTLRFLEDFTRNKGAIQEERQTRIPYLMGFLGCPAAFQTMEDEDRRGAEEAAIIAAGERASREEDRKLATTAAGAFVWGVEQ